MNPERIRKTSTNRGRAYKSRLSPANKQRLTTVHNEITTCLDSLKGVDISSLGQGQVNALARTIIHLDAQISRLPKTPQAIQRKRIATITKAVVQWRGSKDKRRGRGMNAN
jgi:hypothetical protein